MDHPFLTSPQLIKLWLKKMHIDNYVMHDDLSVSVEGDVVIRNHNLGFIPIQFNRVSGSFACQNNNLTTLRGVPHEVGLIFNCSHNQLTSLEFAPKCHSLFCSYNPLDFTTDLDKAYSLNFYSFQHLTEEIKIKGFEDFYHPFIINTQLKGFRIDMLHDQFNLIIEKMKLEKMILNENGQSVKTKL